MDVLGKIEGLFVRRGATRYSGDRAEPVSALEHALQCAQLAEWAHADLDLVAAAFLHDLGQLMDAQDDAPLRDDEHEILALPLLEQGFGPGVMEPIRLHVQAKRFLVSTDAAYEANLSPASRHSLELQGGRMNAEERLLFLAQPHAAAALQLRRWDDLAKHPGKRTPPLSYYLSVLEELLRERRAPGRLLIA